MIWTLRYLPRIDFRILPVIGGLCLISLLVISSATSIAGLDYFNEDVIFTGAVKSQIKRFGLGFAVFVACAALDYQRLREWTWFLYLLMLVLLIGVFFTPSIQSVHRWYRIPLIGVAVQPSEISKLFVVIALSWFLERNKAHSRSLSTAFFASIIVGIPFLLILKQPDLGTALVLYPVTFVMFYFGDVHPWLLRFMAGLGACLLGLVLLIFLGFLPHENIRPYATKFIKEYQFDRLDPNTHHQQAAVTAIAIGGLVGKGWRRGEYTAGGWLPMPATDSVFPAFGEEFGFFGLLFLMALFYALLYLCFRVTAVAKDHFGSLLAAGITTYLAMHILVNIGMMVGLLPITGVPLILVTYGGSSIFATMAALGLIQSIYSRRFMF